ncbi:MAG: hypothetical protein ACE5IR_26405 [bacterium]
MSDPCILLSGVTISSDEELVNKLKKSAMILRNLDNSKIESIMRAQKVDLILIEILREKPSEIRFIQKVTDGFPEATIILIDGDGERDLTAMAFKCGAKDAFRKPYMSDLIVEKVNAILGRRNANNITD